jgi:hypothetical protein
LFSKYSIIPIAILALTFTSTFLTCSLTFVATQNSANSITVTVTSDRGRYTLDEDVKIWGIIFDKQCNPTVATVTIQIIKDNQTLYTVSKVTAPQNGSYFDNGYNVQETGLHEIIVTAYNADYRVNASTSFTAVYYRDAGDLLKAYWQEIVVILIALFYFFIVIAISSEKKTEKTLEKIPIHALNRGQKQEPLPNLQKKDAKHIFTDFNIFFKQNYGKLHYLFRGRFFVATIFLILTVFTMVTVITFLFMPSPVGVTSPLGLVVNTDVSNQTQWVINIGGQPLSGTSGDISQYIGGVQIPVYVIVLSFLGAYVYFLIRIPKLVKKKSSELMNNALFYLIRFFMAPLLAVALYLVLWQVEVRGTFILAAISFATGLIIEQVTKRIIDFAKDAIGKKGPTKKVMDKSATALGSQKT